MPCALCCSATPSNLDFTRTLNYNHETQYSRQPTPPVRHAGQLKLLLSEIEFLTPYKNEPHTTTIYAGAAPGLHIPRLAAMFPSMRFVLVDPMPFGLRGDDGRIAIVQDFMTDRLAETLRREHAEQRILFISDVRIGASSGGESDRDQQLRIQRDMQSQMGWHEILDPAASMLKFRLPWDLEAHTVYLDGTIHLPVFGKHLTHETRLVVARGAGTTRYDTRSYERRMAHFNRVLRVRTYGGEVGSMCMIFLRVYLFIFRPFCALTPCRTQTAGQKMLRLQSVQYHSGPVSRQQRRRRNARRRDRTRARKRRTRMGEEEEA